MQEGRKVALCCSTKSRISCFSIAASSPKCCLECIPHNSLEQDTSFAIPMTNSLAPHTMTVQEGCSKLRTQHKHPMSGFMQLQVNIHASNSSVIKKNPKQSNNKTPNQQNHQTM